MRASGLDLDIFDSLTELRGLMREITICFGGKRKRYPNWIGKRGGCFCMMDAKTGQIVLLTLVGWVPEEKKLKYFLLAQEKAKRLFAHPQHLTSEESKNDGLEQYGGAIRGRKFIYSFSGLPAIGDSLISLKIAMGVERRLGQKLQRKIEELAGITELVAALREFRS